MGWSTQRMAAIGTIIFTTAFAGVMLPTLFQQYDMSPWPAFGLHPVLMSLAFGICMPLSGISYRILELEAELSHSVAKTVHAILNTSAIVVGLAGIIDMYQVHEHGGCPNPPCHFTSLHSWIGISVYATACCQGLVALAVFYFMGQDARQYVKPVHQFFGAALVLMGAFAIATGCLSLVYRGPYNMSGPTTEALWAKINASAILALLSAGCLVTGMVIQSGKFDKSQFHKLCRI